ncbi:hypothetical protein [Tomitella gaofuii]|uniref:hypothetical protein n=1 Tax=Tomitella gaofuii TaxID=2760083 RepID=UPI001F36B6B8|nr:hypothetical protein [Tomitella gaofuii]
MAEVKPASDALTGKRSRAQMPETRPELTPLDDEERTRVLEQLRRREAACDACGGRGFTVGDALYLGFLFLHAEQDEYMVGLTCANPGCPRPRTGIPLHAGEFLSEAHGPHDRRR